MLKNYLIIALRNFRVNKIFTLINIIGLSIGISASLVIFLVVHYDLSFDRFENNGDRIYRVVSNYNMQGNPGKTRGVQGPLADAVKKELSGIEGVACFRYYNDEAVAVPGPDPLKPQVFKKQPGIIFADGNYFNLLPHKWLAGSPKSALANQSSVVLNETRAKLYFPRLSYSAMIGRKILYDSIPTTVTGIVQDLEQQGHTDFNFKEYISLATVLNNSALRQSFEWDNWGSTTSDQQLYVRLGKGTKASSVESGLKRLSDKYLGADKSRSHYSWDYLLQPLSDIHFNGHYGDFDTEMASRPAMYGLILVAVFLLMLGCFNFINLSTAQASRRAKEIGIRKTLGSSRRQLVLQFLGETLLTALLATILSVVAAPYLMKAFADFIPEGLRFSVGHPDVLAFLAILVLVVSLAAGFYPALVLSSWKPLQVLKNQAYAGSGKTRSIWIRQTLTVSQFIIAQLFIMGTVFVTKQIRFLLDKDLGFKKEAILSFSAPSADTSYTKRLFLMQEIRKIPGIALTSLSSDVPASGGTRTNNMQYRPDGKQEISHSVELKFGDTNYLRLFHIPLLAGRNILPCDTVKELIINENYLHLLGFRHPEEAIGKSINLDYYKPVVGVMKDFHAHPLSMDIKPMAYSFSGKDCKTVIVALEPRNSGGDGWKASIAGIDRAYKAVYPGEEFKYDFLDKSIANFYKSEQNISHLLRWATGLTVLISCLGLLGLVIYTTNLRVKEIGIRKVLGASASRIVGLLSKDFIKLVVIAFVIATPIAWWALHEWLDQFAFRTTMNWWAFVFSGLAMIAVSLLTLSIQTIRAARANPVDSLKAE
jgi:predicted permease